MNFEDYLRKAVARVKEDARKKQENGDLNYFINLCRTGVKKNWESLDRTKFFETYHRCIAASGKKVSTLMKYLEGQATLFRHLNPSLIKRDRREIRREHRRTPCYLSPRMVEAMIKTATLIMARPWPAFKAEYLLLPKNAETESLDDWRPARAALKRLPMVGDANGWYLIRNLYGARVMKPDVWIMRIAKRFFPHAKSPPDALAEAVRRSWNRVCPNEPVHLGKVDYILWWYSQATGYPRTKVQVTC